jgi:hypothetical protein
MGDVKYYKPAFDAVDAERLDDEAGNPVVVHPTIGGADLGVQQDTDINPEVLDADRPSGRY